jgi:hypothetical protein
MILETLCDLFLWCALIGAVLLLSRFDWLALAPDWVLRLHSRWFPFSGKPLTPSTKPAWRYVRSASL